MEEAPQVRRPQIKRSKERQIHDRLQRGLNTAVTRPETSGKPRRLFDLRVVEDAGKLSSSYREMAARFNTSERVIHDRMNEVMPENEEQAALLPADWGQFLLAYEKGRESVCRAIRSQQIKLALEGDRQMLVHLGQHLLGQIPFSAMDIKQAITGDFEFTISANPDGDLLNVTPAPKQIEGEP